MEVEAPSHRSDLYRPSMEIAHTDGHRSVGEQRTFGQYQGITGIEESILVGGIMAEASLVAGVNRDVRGVGASVASVSRAYREKSVSKRKRRRPPSNHGKATHKTEEDGEDVCFICFDGGRLVLCDRRGCPKAYHPACIKRDDAFFRSKARWNCGWHICSICEKTSRYMCYTCTYSVCRGCTKYSEILCVRENMGFCPVCMQTILMIEKYHEPSGEMVAVDFDDRSSWEYLFKVYWVFLKEKLCLTLEELRKGQKPCFSGSSGRKGYLVRGCVPPSAKVTDDQLKQGSKGRWASPDLMEFIAHVKNGDTSPLSPFDVHSLLLEYITRSNLRDPCRKTHVKCDKRLWKLFRKDEVGHFEMLKLLELQFPAEENADSGQPVVVAAQGGKVDEDSGGRTVSERDDTCAVKRSSPCSNAVIDVHNIGLIYLRRSSMESMLDATDFSEKVVGTIVRIRLSCSKQKLVYRLVQVVGTGKVLVPYNLGRRTTDTVLHVLNIDKKEIISIESISNQMFAEEECSRFRQSIKSGLVKPLTVVDIMSKARALERVRAEDVRGEDGGQEQDQNPGEGTCSAAASVSSTESNGVDKSWHYQDPFGKVQGPFSMAQLRKWSTTGYFPPDLRIWEDGGKRGSAVLLTDALNIHIEQRPAAISDPPPPPPKRPPSSSSQSDKGEEGEERTSNCYCCSSSSKPEELLPPEEKSTELESSSAPPHEAMNPSSSAFSATEFLPITMTTAAAAVEWSGYSPTPPEEGHHAATPTTTSTMLQLKLGWPTVGRPATEFAEESVSDLLAEADAMDSPKAFTSPPSIMNCEDDDDDCLASIEVLSAFNSAAANTDPFSSICELRMSFLPPAPHH